MVTKQIPSPALKATKKLGASNETKPKTVRGKKAVPPLVRLFQIYYQEQQLPLLDPAFEPYNNIGDKSPLLEFNVFRKLQQDSELSQVQLWGAVSWKFTQKTGLSGDELRQFVQQNPGYDVYYCNPHPETEALYHNLWVQGETSHPNFIVLCQEFFECAGLSLESIIELQPSALFSSTNYFVGSPNFWQKYIQFISEIIAKADAKLTPTTRAILFSSAADQRGLHAGSSYIPFIIERLFSIFLQRAGSGLKTIKIPLPKLETELNIHLKMLRQMKDVAHAQRSPWLAACWANYRTLYMSQFHGKAWSKKYLKSITPTVIRFAPMPGNHSK